jgi:hypothetical protein
MRWISFAQTDSLSRSLLHLFPCSKGGFSAQPIQCSLELFADRPEPAVVALDGMQLNQPDGVRLDEVFPRLKEGGNSLVGVAVNLETVSGKGDLSPSSCAIEIINRFGSVHFPMVNNTMTSKRYPSIAVLTDRATSTSLVIVNQSQRYIELKLKGSSSEKSQSEDIFEKLQSLSIAPGSVSEFSLSGQNNFTGEPFHSLYGDVLLSGQELVGDLSEGVASFITYRDGTTKSISSVVPL